MSLAVFLEVVELRTKVASVFPFVMGVLFSLVYFHEIHPVNTVIFFIGMLVFDLTTTSINNYMDFRKAKSEQYKFEHNVIGREKVPEALVRNMIFGMLALTFVIGLYLTYATGWLLLVMGAVVCFIGVFYTFGPIPLSRIPLGEVFRQHGIQLFQGMMLASYAALLLGFLFGIFQWPILLVFLSLPKIRQNLKAHQASLPHPRSFGYSIKNMILFNSCYAGGLLLCLFWQMI